MMYSNCNFKDSISIKYSNITWIIKTKSFGNIYIYVQSYIEREKYVKYLEFSLYMHIKGHIFGLNITFKYIVVSKWVTKYSNIRTILFLEYDHPYISPSYLVDIENYR